MTTSAWLAAVDAAGLSAPAAHDVAAALAAAAPPGSMVLRNPPNIGALAEATGHDWVTVRRATSQIVAAGFVVAERSDVIPTPLRLVVDPDHGRAR